MNWAAWIVLAVAALVLVAAGAVASNPAAFVYGLGKLALADLWPALRPLLLRALDRMTPEEEAEWRQALREGREREWRNERTRKKLKPIFRYRLFEQRPGATLAYSSPHTISAWILRSASAMAVQPIRMAWAPRGRPAA